MPYIDGKFYKPEQAVTLGCCPECGRDLKDSSYTVETLLHWPRGLDASVASPEAIERAEMLREYFETRGSR